jgi:hypothetical protein
VTRRTTARTLAAVLSGVLLAGCAGQAAPENDTGDGRLALVSGRDDHGLVELDEVPVYDDKAYAHAAGTIHDGTLVRVLERDHLAMRVATLEGPSVTGWLDDFHLRGELRLVGAPPRCVVTVAGAEQAGGTPVLAYGVKDGRVLVTTQAGAGEKAHRGWVARDDLQELPPQGPDCGSEPVGSKHTH